MTSTAGETAPRDMKAIDEAWPSDRAAIFDGVRVRLVGAVDALTRRVLEHYLGQPGKMARARLLMAVVRGSPGGPAPGGLDRGAQAAAAIELLHLGTLYHDDVIDHGHRRRGLTCIHRETGNLAAVLGGDILLAASSQVAAALGRDEYLVMAETLEALCRGQLLEATTIGNLDRTEEDYLAAIEGKTARLMRAAIVLGGIEAGVAGPAIDQLGQAGLDLGLAFQMLDDVLDLVGRTAATGKRQGQDLREGVVTLPVILAMASDPQLRTAVAAAPDDDAAVDAAIIGCLDQGAIVATCERAAQHADAARSALAPHLGDDVAVALIDRVLQRAVVAAELAHVEDGAAHALA